MTQVLRQEPTRDSLRALIDSVFTAPEYDWAERPVLLGWLADGWHWLTTTLQRFQDANPELFRWFQIVLIALLALIILHAMWVMMRTARAAGEYGRAAADSAIEAPRTALWYRDRADVLATDGRFAEALMAVFHALILDLDRRGMVRFHPSKTPREYATETSLASSDRERLGKLVGSLYGYVFGHQQCGPLEYRQWLATAAEGWHAAAV